MSNRLFKTAQYEYLPAISEVIARPAYCVIELQSVTYTSYTNPSDIGFVPDFEDNRGPRYETPRYEYSDSPEYQTPKIPARGGGGTTVYIPPSDPVTTTRYYRVRRCFDAVEGVEGRDASFNPLSTPAWDGLGTSIGLYRDDFYFAFDFNPDGVGMLCGLMVPGQAVSYNNILFGMTVLDGTVVIIENGRSGQTTVDSGVLYVDGLPLRIQRVGGSIRYKVGSWDYTSDKTYETSLSVGAVLYAPGDYVDNPRVSEIHPLSIRSSWLWIDHDTAFAISASIPWGWGGDATIGDGFVTVDLPLLVRASQEKMGEAALDVGGVSVAGNDLAVLVQSGIVTQLPMTLYAQGAGTSIGHLESSIGGPILLAADYSYGGAELTVADLFLFALSTGEPDGVGSASELSVVIDQYITDPVIYALLQEDLSVGYSFTVVLAIDAGLVDYLIPGDALNANLVFMALLESGIQVSDNAASIRTTMLQYATNLLTGAVGRYEGFEFQGFAKVGLQTYGWKPDGVYALGYAQDTGEEINALIDFAAEDFDTTNRKAVRALFFGVDTDGTMYARLVDDLGVERTYHVIAHGDTHRANPAQKPTSRFWRLRLEVVGASYADLDNIEWKLTTTGRRTRS